MKSPLNLLDGISSPVRSRSDDPRATTVDAQGPQVAGSATKDVSPAQAKKFDALLAEAVENETASAAGGKTMPGATAKATSGASAKVPLSTLANAQPEPILDVAPAASPDGLDVPVSKQGRAAQRGAQLSVQVVVDDAVNTDSFADEVPLKTTAKTPSNDLPRDPQNVLPSGPSSFHSTISHAAKQAAREVPTGTMPALPQTDVVLDAALAPASEQTPVDEADGEHHERALPLTVEETSPSEEPRAPSAPLAAVLENIATLVSRIVAPPPATAMAASVATESDATSPKLEPTHGDLSHGHDALRAGPEFATPQVDAQAFRDFAAQAAAPRVANTNQGEAPRVGPSVSAQVPATEGAPLPSPSSPAVDAASASGAPVVRVDASGARTGALPALPVIGREVSRATGDSPAGTAPALPTEAPLTLSASERALVSRAAASMMSTPATQSPASVQTAAPSAAGAGAPGTASPALEGKAPAAAATNAAVPSGPRVPSTNAAEFTGAPVVAPNVALPTTTGAATPQVVANAERAGATTPVRKATSAVERVPASAPFAAATTTDASRAVPAASPAPSPAQPAAVPNAAPEGLRASAANAPAEAAAPVRATPVTTPAAQPGLEPVPVALQPAAIAQQGSIASAEAANLETASSKAARAGEPPSDGPIAPLRGFSRGAFVGHALSAYGGRGHDSSDQQSTRGRFSEEREARPEITRNTEANVAADFSALQQLAQPTHEAAPAPVASPQPAAPMAPAQPIVDVPAVEFAARPPAAQHENASVSLHHPDLGPIRLDVQRTADRIEVHAVIESVHAEAVLRANESGIRQSVQQSGMTFSALRVRVRGEETNASRQAQVRRRRANERET